MRLIFKRSDGSVAIGMFLDGVDPAEEMAKYNQSVTGAPAISVRQATIEDSPPPGWDGSKSDRTFREAWTDEVAGPQIDVDMPKARTIHMDRIREKRNAKLTELDLAYMIADENGDNPSKAAIAQQKKVLRDLPGSYDLSGHTSPDTLKDDWPTEVE